MMSNFVCLSNTDQAAETFHERRKQTNYLVGFEDFEPIVCDLINTTDLTAKRVENGILELRKEFNEFKTHIEKVTAKQDLNILNPIKALMSE